MYCQGQESDEKLHAAYHSSHLQGIRFQARCLVACQSAHLLHDNSEHLSTSTPLPHAHIHIFIEPSGMLAVPHEVCSFVIIHVSLRLAGVADRARGAEERQQRPHSARAATRPCRTPAQGAPFLQAQPAWPMQHKQLREQACMRTNPSLQMLVLADSCAHVRAAIPGTK